MPNDLLERKHELWYRRLFLPAYAVKDAARYSNTKPATINDWYYGNNPILTLKEQGKPLSYMQLIEVAFVAFFRRLGISMQRIRKSKDYIAQNFAAEYPFVQYRFKTEGHHILMEYLKLEPSREFDKNNLIVTDSNGQLAWGIVISEKFAEFEYEHELALRWHPAGTASAVLIDPRIAFGAPMVSGVPTWAIRGRWIAGETIEEIEDDFSLDRKFIIDGLNFEGITVNNDNPVLG